MNALFKVLGISKQSFYQMLKRRRYKLEEQEQLIPLINQVREVHPRMSARDIYQKLQPQCMGRDQFERFCMDSGYRVKKIEELQGYNQQPWRDPVPQPGQGSEGYRCQPGICE